MTTETTVNDAPTGAAEQQKGQATGATGATDVVVVTATPAPTFTTEQQAHIDRLVGERLERERKAQQARIDKAKADAEAALLIEQGKFKEAFEKAEAERAEAVTRLAQMEHDQMRRDAAQAAGIPALWQRLQGATAEELAEDAKALAAMMQPAQPGNGQPGRTATTTPTPAPQGRNGLTDEERRQKAARTF